MKLPLIAQTIAGVILATCFAHAAPTASAPAPVIFNAVSAQGSVRGLFYDLGKNRVQVTAGPTALSMPYTAPEGGNIQFYRLGPPVPPSTEPAKIPVSSVSLGDKGPYLVLIIGTTPESMKVQVMDNSWDKNPLLSSRVINASRRKTAIKLDATTAELAPGEVHTFPPPAKPIDVIELKIATLDETRWNLRLLTPQALFPFTRNTFILKEQIPSLENPNPVDLDVFTIVDATQPPPRSI